MAENDWFSLRSNYNYKRLVKYDKPVFKLSFLSQYCKQRL